MNDLAKEPRNTAHDCQDADDEGAAVKVHAGFSTFDGRLSMEKLSEAVSLRLSAFPIAGPG